MDLTLGKPAFQSVAFAQRMAVARALLARPRRPSRAWPALTAALFFAVTSMAFVGIVVLAPTPFASAPANSR